MAGAIEGGSHIEVEQQGEIGKERQTFDGVDAVYEIERQAPPVSLIGEGRILESVAEDHAAFGEARSNHLLDMLGACRRVEKEFACGSHARIVGMEDQTADLVSDRRSARLAGENVLDALLLEMIGEHLDLRRLSGSLNTLERYESTQVTVLP